MSLSSSMMPERVVCHSATNYYDSAYPLTITPSAAPPYLYRTDICTTPRPKAWSNAKSTCKQAHTPLPEISEFLREETMKISRSPSGPLNSFPETVEAESHFVNDDGFNGQTSSHFRNDASSPSDDNLSKRICSEKNCNVYDEPYRPPRKKKIRKEQRLTISENQSTSPEDQLPLTGDSMTQLLPQDAKDVKEKSTIKSLNSSHLLNETSHFPLSYNFPGESLCRSNNQLPYFTSLMLDDDLSVNSFYQNKVFPEKGIESEQLQEDETSKQASTTGSRSKDTLSKLCVPNSNESNKKLDSRRVTGNKFFEVCSNKQQECASVSVGTIETNDKMIEDYVFDKSSPPSYIKLECQDPNANLHIYRRSNQNDLKEITWEDATTHTQQPDDALLSSQSSESLLDDIDLSEVDNACMEHFERECQKEAVKEIEMACNVLHIPTDVDNWTEGHVDKWIMWTVGQCNLPAFDMTPLRMSGVALCKLGEAEMLSVVPTCGDIIHARLRLWKSAAKMFEIQAKHEMHSSSSDALQRKNVSFSSGKDNTPKLNTVPGNLNAIEESETPSSFKPAHTSSIHLWMFLKELLLQPQVYGRYIRWIDKEKGVFKIEDSVEVARLWGVRKNRPAMNYDKLSRSIRQYYKKGIIKKTTVSQRLVYQFVNPTIPMPI